MAEVRRPRRAQRLLRPSWRTPSNLAQIAVSIAVAVLYGVATLLAGQAAGHWESSTRAEVRWSQSVVETVRHVYADQAQAAFAVAESEVLATALRANDRRPAVAGEAATAETLAAQLRFQSRDDPGVLAEEYELDGGGFDLDRRLADLLAEDDVPDHVTLATLDRGDGAAWWARRIAWSAVILVGLFMLGRVGVRRARRRPTRPPARPHHAVPRSPDVGIVPQPAETKMRVRPFAYVALASWILVTVLPAAQLDLATRSDRVGADATRQAVELTAHTVGGQLSVSMRIGAQQAAIRRTQRALSRRLSALDSGNDAQASLGVAEERASEAWLSVLGLMIRPPSTEDGLDAEVVAILSSGPADWERLRLAQNDSVDRAATQGRSSNVLAFAVLLAALAGVFATAAATGDHPDRRLWPGTLALLVAACCAVVLAGATLVLG